MCKTSAVAERDGDGWIECECGSRHWGRFGAAGLLLISQGNVLLQHRAPWVHNGDTWGIPGGARDSHETPLEAALREASEEIGLDSRAVTVASHHCDDHGIWKYDTIIATCEEDVRLENNKETLATQWFGVEEITALNLHPSFARSWREINEIVRNIVGGAA